MRKIILLISCIFIASCTLEVSDNEKLDGYWQLTSLDTIATGRNINMKDSAIFWAVQNELLITRSTQSQYRDILYRFKYTKDSISLREPYILYRDSFDIKVTDVSSLKPFGINTFEENFRILELNKSKMILKSNMLILYFRRY